MNLKKIIKIIVMVLAYVAFSIMLACAILNPTAANIIPTVAFIALVCFIDSRNDWFILGFLARQDTYDFYDYTKGEKKNEDDSL